MKPEHRRTVSRREFIVSSSAMGVGWLVRDRRGDRSAFVHAEEPPGAGPAAAEQPFFLTRGVVVLPDDIQKWPPWSDRAKQAGLNTLGMHTSPAHAAAFVKTGEGQAFLNSCRELGLEVEFELHAISDLLPRGLFDQDPTMFPMNEDGERVRDYNLCVHSKEAVEIACGNAVKYAEVLKPTTDRYFYWVDDYKPMCRCPQCRVFSDSDQALILENQMFSSLRAANPKATLAHLAYYSTLPAPSQVKPERGIFLEFAPMQRRFDAPLSRRDARFRPQDPTHGEHLDFLDANLDVFGRRDARVLEYWIDESLFARRSPDRQMAKIDWHAEVFADDLKSYAKRGIRHITSFAVGFNREYVERFGEPPLGEYAQGLVTFQPSE